MARKILRYIYIVSVQVIVLYKYESPVGAGGLTHNLGVHQVAQTDAGCGKRGSHADHVNALQDLDLVLAAVEYHSYDYSYGAAVTGQTAVARQLPAALRQESYREQHLDYPPETGQVVFGLIEYAVTQTGTGQNTYEAV